MNSDTPQCLAVFSNTQLRSRLIERVQGMLELYLRPVIIVEAEAARGSPTPHQAIGRSRYLDTIVCAFAQITHLKLLYSRSQGEAPSTEYTTNELSLVSYSFIHVQIIGYSCHVA